MKPLIIIPARQGSKGIPDKNFRTLPGGGSLVTLAIDFALQLGGQIVLSTDHPAFAGRILKHENRDVTCLARPDVLSGDNVPMALVVEHVLTHVAGEPEQPVVLLQPTTPNRSVGMVRKCLKLVDEFGLCAATMSKVPDKYSRGVPLMYGTAVLPPRRQDCPETYVFTGDCYAFRRSVGWPTMRVWTAIVVGESINIDTPADWANFCDSRQRRAV